MQLLPKPPALRCEVAGSLYAVAAVATAAVGAIDPRPGEAVAVSAASGGVGTVVVQLLTRLGVRVLAISSPEHAVCQPAPTSSSTSSDPNTSSRPSIS